MKQLSAEATSNPPRLPAHFSAAQFAVPQNIASFLRRIDEHQRKTANLDVGGYGHVSEPPTPAVRFCNF